MNASPRSISEMLLVSSNIKYYKLVYCKFKSIYLYYPLCFVENCMKLKLRRLTLVTFKFTFYLVHNKTIYI